MPYAVEDRQDHSVWANCRGELVHGFIKRIRLYANQNEIKRFEDGARQHGGRRNLEITMRTNDLQALAGELLSTAVAHHEGDVAPGANKTSAKVTP